MSGSIMVTLFNESQVRAWCAEHGYGVRSTGASTRAWMAQSAHHSTTFRIGDTLVFQSARIAVHHPRD
ncbi:MAG: hypothetical protein LBQ06_02470 [Frankiaceae bacterium]|nr:hypothetical protein [Frankiaceae bacterium]